MRERKSMETEQIIKELQYTAKKHANDKLFTGQTDITAMCNDIIPKMQKLKEYEDLEERGKIQTFPCGFGADVYFVPSGTSFKLNVLSKHEENNRVYHQIVKRITLHENGWYMEGDEDLENGTGRVLLDKLYGQTWFLSPEEAEAKLKEYRGEKRMDTKDAKKVITELQTHPFICSENEIELDNGYVILRTEYYKRLKKQDERSNLK